MNVFNRLVVVLLTIAALILILVVVIAAGPVFDSLVAVSLWLQRAVTDYTSGPDKWYFFAGRVVVGGALFLVGLLILWLELRRPRKKIIRAQKLSGGQANITIDSIAQRVAYHIDQLPDVVRVVPRISGRSNAVDVDLLLETSPEIDVPMKTEEVMQVTKEVIGERMGLRLGKVTINIKHAPYPEA